MNTHLACCAITAVLASASVFADGAQNQTDTELKSPWSFNLGLDYSRNGYKDSHHLASRNLAANAMVKYNFTQDISVAALFSGYHSYDFERGQYWDDIWLTTNKNNLWTPTDNISVSVGARVLVPISEFSKKTDLQSAVRGDLNFSLALDSLIEGLRVSDAVRLRKNFHRYTTVGSLPLEEYRLSNSFAVDYTKNNWFININFATSTSWSYRGTTYSPKLTHAEELGYQFTEHFSSAVGMTNSAAYYDPDRGPSPLSTLFDLKNPTYYIKFNYHY